MSVTLSPKNFKKFLATRSILTIMKNNGNDVSKSVTNDEVMDFLLSHSPISKEVEDFMNQTVKITRKISEKRDELLVKGEPKP